MKKLLFAAFFVVFVACSPHVVNPQSTGEPNIFVNDVYQDSMHYKVFTTFNGISVTNVTLDSIMLKNLQ